MKLLAAGRRADAALFNLRRPAIMLPDTGKFRYRACLQHSLGPTSDHFVTKKRPPRALHLYVDIGKVSSSIIKFRATVVSIGLRNKQYEVHLRFMPLGIIVT